MCKCHKTIPGSFFVSTTYHGPKPGDFPVGSLESRAAARAIVEGYAEEQRNEEEAEIANFTPSEQAVIQAMLEDVESPGVRTWMIRLFRVAQERARIYEQDLILPTPDEIRRRRAAAKDIEHKALEHSP
jgi:hypothetical protein